MIDVLNQLLAQSPVVQGGLALMVAGWLGYQLRSLPGRVAQFVREWTTRVIQIRESHPLYSAWLEMLTEHAVRPSGPRTVEVRLERDDYGTRTPASKFAAGSDPFWARVAGKWCRVCVQREEGALNRVNLAPRYEIIVEVVLGTRADLARMLADVTRRADVMEHRQLVDLYDRYGSSNTVTIPKRDPATLCLPAGLFESVESRLREFCSAREQYERCGIPWRFGILLSGEPDTGKTSLAHALASRLGLRLAVITLADLESDHELVSVFRSVTDQAIVLIKDVDCAFRERSAESAECVSFSGFLNCIDGVLAPHNGRVLIMSTNHVDRLDPALIRPGRIDLHINVPMLDRQDAADYADRVFPHVATRHDVVNEVMSGRSPTPAILINRLTQQKWHRTSATIDHVATRPQRTTDS
ncbi:MAG: AAA family ATPase [Phycisphaerales bacterium]